MTCLMSEQFNCLANYNDDKISKSQSQTISTSVAANESQQLGLSQKRDPTTMRSEVGRENDQNHAAHMLLWDDLLHDTLAVNDENDDDGDDSDEEEEDEEDFYSQNPVDSSAGESKVSGDLGADIKVGNSDFQDFDDHEALRSADFYPSSQNFTQQGTKFQQKPRETSSSTRRRLKKRAGKEIQRDKYEFAESSSANASQCALFLQRGGCITFGVVEWALRRARNILRFQRPTDLNSLEPTEASINAVGELVELTTRILAQRYQLNWIEIAAELSQIDIRQTSLWQTCPLLYRSNTICLMQGRYRTHTGQCNNLMAPYLGSSFMPFARALPADYSDSVGLPRRSSATGNQLPPARLLALYLHPDMTNPSSDISALFMNWGQLVNHDLAMASGARVATGHSDQCCSRRASNNERICMPIQIGPNDPVYGPLGISCLDFKRSLAGLRPGCSLGPRIQLNTITSFVDASFVYGSRKSTTQLLRRSQRGLLNTWQYFREPLKPLLPPQTENPDEECRGRQGDLFCFLSGDARTNQQIQLAALHTYHTRQHNRLARALQIMNPHWTDNRLYHEARHIHIAIVQHILVSEYLPVLLGQKLIAKYGLEEAPLGQYWDHYNPEINPSITQAFAAAAFRQGHTSVPSEVYRFNGFHEPSRVYQLRHLFRQPWALYEPGALDEFLLGMLDAPAASFDPFVSSELSGHLLQEPGERVGLDLTAINIQRGRDQGVASYNSFREWCGLGKANSFEDLTEYMDNRTSFLMSQFYESVDDIDLFSGGISEFPLADAQIGPTFGCIIGRQFEQLRSGDRFWFESSQGAHAFTLDQLDSIKQVTLARLLCANSDNVITIQARAFQLPHPVLNPRVYCSQLPDLDISLWQDISWRSQGG